MHNVVLCFLNILNKCVFIFVFSDSGQNYSASSKGERLSARLRALPGTNEPYESSSNKEIGKCPHPVPPHTAGLEKTGETAKGVAGNS